MNIDHIAGLESLEIDLTAPIAAGGEAKIYAIRRNSAYVAKIYHDPTPDRAAKLGAMLANPPETRLAATGHTIIAWPLSRVQNRGRVAGFVMPRASGMRPVFDFYNPRTRREHCPGFHGAYLYRAARNLAAAVSSLHANGYVIGDVNESNILVSETALVTLVDTDSFQVRDVASGHLFRCLVGKPEFTPPELHGKSFAELDRRPEQDMFGVAVLIFQLLMEGTHPFAGVYTGKGEAPTQEARVLRGHFPHGNLPNIPYKPKPLAPPFTTLAPALRELFLQAFVVGHHHPGSRPDAATWVHALDAAEQALMTCARDPLHRYGSHLSACPWCERAATLQRLSRLPKRRRPRIDYPTYVRVRQQASQPVPVRRVPNLRTPVVTYNQPQKKGSLPIGVILVIIYGAIQAITSFGPSRSTVDYSKYDFSTPSNRNYPGNANRYVPPALGGTSFSLPASTPKGALGNTAPIALSTTTGVPTPSTSTMLPGSAQSGTILIVNPEPDAGNQTPVRYRTIHLPGANQMVEVHAAPSQSSAVLYTIPYDYGNITGMGAPVFDHDDWWVPVRVSSNKFSGYINRVYLEPAPMGY